MKILIVDDEFVNRMILKNILSPIGHCDVAESGHEAIEAFQLSWENNTPYKLICMDIMMPEMDGQEALQEIRNIEKKIGIKQQNEAKAIMITALGDPKNVIEAFLKGGATDYIVKPIDKDKLYEKIKDMGLIL